MVNYGCSREEHSHTQLGDEPMKIELKNLKVCTMFSHETFCFEADFYVDGKKEGTVENRGDGEANHVRWEDRSMESKVEAYAKSLPPYQDTEYNQELPMDLDFYISLMVDAHLDSVH